jgi:hypothetical protein
MELFFKKERKKMKVCPKCESMLPDRYEACPKCKKPLDKAQQKSFKTVNNNQHSDKKDEKVSPYVDSGDIDDFGA